jgi:NADH-quinone oxidoreductase subunit N
MIELLRLTTPEILVALLGLFVLVIDLSRRHAPLPARVDGLAGMAVAGCVFAFTCIHAQGALPGGLLVVTPLSLFVQRALLLLALLVLILCSEERFTPHIGEYCALILFATTAMMLLVSTQNLLVIFITIESLRSGCL